MDPPREQHICQNVLYGLAGAYERKVAETYRLLRCIS